MGESYRLRVLVLRTVVIAPSSRQIVVLRIRRTELNGVLWQVGCE